MSEARNVLARDWQSAGLRAGDTVLVHSSVSRTLRRIASMGERPDPSIIVQSLLDAVGDSGTVVFPLLILSLLRGFHSIFESPRVRWAQLLSQLEFGQERLGPGTLSTHLLQ